MAPSDQVIDIIQEALSRPMVMTVDWSSANPAQIGFEPGQRRVDRRGGGACVVDSAPARGVIRSNNESERGVNVSSLLCLCLKDRSPTSGNAAHCSSVTSANWDLSCLN